MANQLDYGVQLVVMWSKVRAEKTGQPQVHKEGALAGPLYSGKKTQWVGSEMEFP